MKMKRSQVIIGLACVLVSIASLSLLLSSPKNLGSRSVDAAVFDEAAFAKAMLRRGMIDTASHRFSRAKRAFDVARRAARDDEELVKLIDAEAIKLEQILRKGDAR